MFSRSWVVELNQKTKKCVRYSEVRALFRSACAIQKCVRYTEVRALFRSACAIQKCKAKKCQLSTICTEYRSFCISSPESWFRSEMFLVKTDLWWPKGTFFPHESAKFWTPKYCQFWVFVQFLLTWLRPDCVFLARSAGTQGVATP